MLSRKALIATSSALLASMVMGAEGSSCTLSTDIGLAPSPPVEPADAGVEPPGEPDAGPGLGNVVTVSPSVVVLSRGQRFTFEALVTPPPSAEGEQLTNKIVTWSIREGNLGGVVTQSSETSNGSPKGEYVAGQIPGTYVVRARSDFDPAAVGEATVVVKRVAVSISPPQATVQPGDTLPFVAHVTGATNTAIAWGIIEGPGTAGIVSNTGKYQANVPGTYHLKATSIEDPTVSAVATITVTSDDLLDIEVCPSDATIAPGDSLTFTPSAAEVSWSIVPVGGQPTGGAAMTAATLFAGPAEGTFLVRATSTVDPSKHVDATVRVRTPSTQTLRGRVTYTGTETGRIFVTGEGGWAGTVLADGDGNTRLFRLRGARAEAQPRWLRAWMDTLGTGHYVPHLSPTGLIDLGTGPLPNHQVTIQLDDPFGTPPTPGQLSMPRVHLLAGQGALVCLDPLLEDGHEAASAYELVFDTDEIFNTIEATVAIAVAGPRCAYYQATDAVTRYIRARAIRGQDTGAWSTTTSFEVPAADTGSVAVTGSLYFSELPANSSAVAYVALVPLTPAPDADPVPREHWTRLTNLQNPMAFDFQDVSDGKYSVHWAIDFDGDDSFEYGDLLLPSAEEVIVAGEAVGNLTVNVPAFGALAQVTTHNPAGPGMSVQISASGLGHQAWQHAVTQLPSALGVHAPLDLFTPSTPDRGTSLPADDGLQRGATIRLNSTQVRGTNDQMVCTHETSITGVLDPVAKLWVDAAAVGTSMHQPLVRWQPITTRPGAPSIDRYVVKLSGPSTGLPVSATLSSFDTDLSWTPVEADLSPGMYQLEVVAIDTRGNTSTTTVPHAVLTPPIELKIRKNEPAALPTFEWKAPETTAGIKDHVIVVTRVSDEKVLAEFYAPASATSAQVNSPLDPTSYKVTVARRNAWGQATQSDEVSFAVFGPPTLKREHNKQVAKPEFTYVYDSEPLGATDLIRTLSGDAMEDPSAVTEQPSATIKYFKPGEEEPLPVGTYLWHVRAVDADGRYADATLEWVVFGAPQNPTRQPSPANSPKFTWARPDTPQSVALTYAIKIESKEGQSWSEIGKDLSGIEGLTLDVTELYGSIELSTLNAEHRWHVRAYDELDNYSESTVAPLAVFGPPTALSSTPPTTDPPVAATYSATLPQAAISTKWSLTITGDDFETRTGTNETTSCQDFTCTFDVTPPAGNFTLTARVTDDSGEAWMEAQKLFCGYEPESGPCP